MALRWDAMDGEAALALTEPAHRNARVAWLGGQKVNRDYTNASDSYLNDSSKFRAFGVSLNRHESFMVTSQAVSTLQWFCNPQPKEPR